MSFSDFLSSFISGTLGGAGLVAVGQPFDTIKTKMQTFPELYKEMGPLKVGLGGTSSEVTYNDQLIITFCDLNRSVERLFIRQRGSAVYTLVQLRLYWLIAQKIRFCSECEPVLQL